MGSADVAPDADAPAIEALAKRLGAVIAQRGCVLVTGATTGLPDLVSRAARAAGGLTIGISPAATDEEHVGAYGLPSDGVDLIVYTGLGKNGRNVVNVRTSDVVIVIGGGIGTLNEFTIAYGEGKVIGILEGSGGIADRTRELVDYLNQPTTSRLIFLREPEALVDACVAAIRPEP